jgi:RNA polymerase sigma-70 factor (ECF subfamily)
MADSADTGGVMQKLLTQAFGGDKDALGRLLELHRGYLRALAQRELGGGLDARLSASDLVQQTCLSAYRNFPQFQGEQVGEFVVWLRRIHERNVHDAVRQHVQAGRRAVDKEQPLDRRWAQEMAASREPSPSARAMANEQAVVLTLALEELPPDQREAVRLRHLEGLPLAEIADRLGRSEDAVAGLLKRGMRTLRERLKEEDQGAP